MIQLGVPLVRGESFIVLMSVLASILAMFSILVARSRGARLVVYPIVFLENLHHGPSCSGLIILASVAI